MQISILGCGWLGLPLAGALVEDGHGRWGQLAIRDPLGQLPRLVTRTDLDPAHRHAGAAAGQVEELAIGQTILDQQDVPVVVGQGHWWGMSAGG